MLLLLLLLLLVVVVVGMRVCVCVCVSGCVSVCGVIGGAAGVGWVVVSGVCVDINIKACSNNFLLPQLLSGSAPVNTII